MNASPFSPYEEHLASNAALPVGLFAFIDAEKLAEAEALLQTISQTSSDDLENLAVHTRDIGSKRAVFAIFMTTPKHLQTSPQLLSQQVAGFKELEKLLSLHPRAVHGQAWLRMEWVNRVATSEAFPHNSKTVNHMGFVAGLKPESEAQYRTLHNANWPAVAEAMAAANYRNWTSHLVEIDDALYLFTDVEYIGTDIEQDNQIMAADPTTQRWWQLTEPCLIDLHDEGNWSSMKTLLN